MEVQSALVNKRVQDFNDTTEAAALAAANAATVETAVPAAKEMVQQQQ